MMAPSGSRGRCGALTALVFAFMGSTAALDNGLGLAGPAMGWCAPLSLSCRPRTLSEHLAAAHAAARVRRACCCTAGAWSVDS